MAMEDENDDVVLSARSDSTGIVIGGNDFDFDDDNPPTTSIHNPTVD